MKSVGEAAAEMVEEVKRQWLAAAKSINPCNPNGSLKAKKVVDEETVEAMRTLADPAKCVAISTQSSLREMIAPGALVILSPLIAGTFFGIYAVYGLLTGSLLSSVQLAISMSNTGGAWDNCKKYVSAIKVEDSVKEAWDANEAKPIHERKKMTFGTLHRDDNIREWKYVNDEWVYQVVDDLYLGKMSDIHKASVIGDTVGDPLKDTSGPALNIVMKLMAIISLVFADYFYAINHGRGLFKVSQ